MTRDEVVAAVGAPPTQQIEDVPLWSKYALKGEPKMDGWERYDQWAAGEDEMFVGWDETDRVGVVIVKSQSLPPSWLDRIRTQLGIR
jgi:hypothetical protein